MRLSVAENRGPPETNGVAAITRLPRCVHCAFDRNVHCLSLRRIEHDAQPSFQEQKRGLMAPPPEGPVAALIYAPGLLAKPSRNCHVAQKAFVTCTECKISRAAAPVALS